MTSESVPLQIRVADGFLTRARGLLGNSALKPNQALLLRPCNAIHTFFMKQKIDVLFLDKSGKVHKIDTNLPAWKMSFCFSAHAVLEIAAGQAQQRGWQEGTDLSSCFLINQRS